MRSASRRPQVLLLHYDFAFVEHGPLPPHERTWRHPSEVAAEQHARARAETAGPTTRAFAFTSGTLGLIAVGMLVLAVTPGRNAAPVAISATTTPTEVAVTQVAIVTTIITGPERAPLGLRGRPEALATPIGEGRLALVTAADLAATAPTSDIGTSVEVAVPSGRMHAARVIAHAGDTVVVELERAEPGVELADELPEGHEIVTVLAVPPVTIVLDDLATLDVEEGTAVLDDTGELVGLCSLDQPDTGTRLLPIDDELLTSETDPAERDADRDDGTPVVVAGSHPTGDDPPSAGAPHPGAQPEPPDHVIPGRDQAGPPAASLGDATNDG